MDPLSLYLTYAAYQQPTETGEAMSGLVWLFLSLFIIAILANAAIAGIKAVSEAARLSKLMQKVTVMKQIDRDGDIQITIYQGTERIHAEYINVKRVNWDDIGRLKGFKVSGQTRTETKVVYKNTGDFWRVFLDLEGTNNVTQAVVMKNYKKLAMEYHPDKPSGSQELMKKLNRAKDEALKVVK